MKILAYCLTIASAVFATSITSATAEVAAVGKPAPAFSIMDSNGKEQSLESFRGKYVVLEWTNRDCPFVKKHYSGGNMQRLQESMTNDGAVWLTVNSSAEGKQGYVTPAVANELMKKDGAKQTAYLMDADGTVGKKYAAKTTPHMYLIDPTGTLVYAGAIDDTASTDSDDIKKSKNLIEAAYKESKAGTKVTVAASEPYGCSIKYKL